VELKAQKLKAQRTFMKTLSSPIQRNRRGYALIIILLSLAFMLIIFASMMYWTSSNSTVTARNNQFNMSEAAAEAATEKVLGQMNFDYVAQCLSNNETYYGTQFLPTLANEQASWPIKYVYSGTNGGSDQISVHLGEWTTNTVPLGSQYTNLYGLKQDCTVTAIATPIGQPFTVPATVCESIEFAAIPLFQFAIFYNMDLEIDPGATMPIKGAVWSNGGIWSGTPNVTYSSTVAAAGKIYYKPNATNDPWCSGKTDGGTPVGNFAVLPSSGNDRITMPIGTNNDANTVAALIDLPPDPYIMNTANAYTTNGMVYFANGADLYLTNWGINSSTPRGTNMILYYQDVANGPIHYQVQLTYDFYIITNRVGTNHGTFTTNYVPPSMGTNSTNYANSILYAGFSFLTNVVFYDWREGWNGGAGPPKAVQAVQINIGKYNSWLTNDTGTNNGGRTSNDLCRDPNRKSHPIDSIYIYNGVPLTGTTLPAVRVYNGGMMPTETHPYGFTVATAMPLYVYGDYNVSNTTCSCVGKNNTGPCTWPAALIGDSITVLSTNWQDANSTFAQISTCTSGGPPPKTTTVNAAMVEGIVPSTNTTYCGGVENFLRLLESWSGVALWYNGSIVVMFPSQIATNVQQTTGKYYNAPTRNWAFDTNFTQQIGLPPLTPQCKGVIRASWAAY